MASVYFKHTVPAHTTAQWRASEHNMAESLSIYAAASRYAAARAAGSVKLLHATSHG